MADLNVESNAHFPTDCLDDKQISNNARHFLQRLEQVKAEKTARGLSTQNTQATEDELVDELTEIFEKRFLDHMESNFSVGSVSYDELSFKAWQSRRSSILAQA